MGSNPIAVTIISVMENVDILRYKNRIYSSATVKELVCGSVYSVSVTVIFVAVVAQLGEQGGVILVSSVRVRPVLLGENSNH